MSRRSRGFPLADQEEEDHRRPSNAKLYAEIQALRSEVCELKAAVSGLVDVWRTGKGVFSFLRFASKVVTSVSAIAAAAYAMRHWLIGAPHS